MKNKFLIIALTSTLLLVGRDSEKVIKEKTAASVKKLAIPQPKRSEKKPQTPEEIIANTEPSTVFATIVSRITGKKC
jgi:hypothetical protein